MRNRFLSSMWSLKLADRHPKTITLTKKKMLTRITFKTGNHTFHVVVRVKNTDNDYFYMVLISALKQPHHVDFARDSK